MANPEICIAPLLPKERGKPKEKPKPKKRIACPDLFKVTGPVRVDPYSTAFLIEPFTMRVHFQQDDLWADPNKDPYCDCNCGEYRQYVRGYFYHPTFPGFPPRMQDHELAYGRLLDVNELREDGPHPYGHRYEDAARTVLRPNEPNDAFLDDHGADDPRNGCLYLGDDAPGVFPSALDEEVDIYLEFYATPWDACNDHQVGSWQSWIIHIKRDPNAKVV
jgi:hypothetical protein